MSVINTTTNEITTIALVNDLIPTGVAVSPDGDHVYVTAYSSVQVIDTNPANTDTYNTVVATINDVATEASSFGVAVSPDGSLVYVATRSKGALAVIDTETNTTVATIDLANGPGLLAVNDNSVYVTDGSNTVTVISIVSTTPTT